jgi:hypothetical protein
MESDAHAVRDSQQPQRGQLRYRRVRHDRHRRRARCGILHFLQGSGRVSQHRSALRHREKAAEVTRMRRGGGARQLQAQLRVLHAAGDPYQIVHRVIGGQLRTPVQL